MRPLNDDEKGTIRTVKQKVNAVINQERKALTQQLKEEMRGRRRGVRSDRARAFEKQRDTLKPITGDPVQLKVGDSQILLDYQVVRKAMRLTERFQRDIRIEDDALKIEYRDFRTLGDIELYPLKGHERLENLPVVEVC